MTFLLGVILSLVLVTLVISAIQDNDWIAATSIVTLVLVVLLIGIWVIDISPRLDLADCIVVHESMEICDKLNIWKTPTE